MWLTTASVTHYIIGNNLLVASAQQNDACVYELSPRRVAVRRHRDWTLVTTNHFEHEAMVARQEGWVIPNSLDRCTRLGSLCNNGSAGAVEAAAFLRDTHSLAADGNEWSCLENPGTIYSTLAEPATGRIWLRVNDRPEREFVEIRASWAERQVRVGV